MSGSLLVLDSLFDTLDIETAAAARLGWTIERWNKSPSSLGAAEAVVHVTTRVDDALQDRMTACRVVGRFGTGLDTVDQQAAARRGISVVGVRHYCVPELTTHTLALGFALDRQVNGYEPDWSWETAAQSVALPGRRRATVVGFGAIGQAVATALAALSINVRVVTHHDAARAAGFETVPLDEGLAHADYLFLHAALTADNAKLIGEAQIDRLPEGAILVNTARFGLVDDSALAKSLAAGRIGGAGLDVRLPSTSPLRHLLGDPRLLVTPHIGWYSRRSADELRRRTIEETIAEAMRLRVNARRSV